MRRKLIYLFLFCVALLRGHAQGTLVPPDEGPDFNWEIATMGGKSYNSLESAFEDLNQDGQIITLVNGTTVKKAVTVDYTTTLALGGLPLVFTTDAQFTIGKGKTFYMTGQPEIRHSGSFKLGGEGNFFAGADVNLTGISVLDAARPAVNLYRVLVQLPSNDGEVSNLTYGKQAVTRFTQKDGVLCCWLTQSVATQTIQFSYIPKGGTNESYATAPLAVTLHANTVITCAKQDSGSGTVTNVAEVNGNVYETLGKAIDAVKTGGTISLINNAVLNEVVKPTGKIVLQLNGFTLSSSGVAGMEPGEGGSFTIEKGTTAGGRVTGTFSINDRCQVAGSVPLTAAILRNGKQVYRTRLILPADAKDKTVAYTYANETGQALTPSMEESELIAYRWMVSHSPATFVLSYDGKAVTLYDIAIQTNHDNTIDLRKGAIEASLYNNAEGTGTGTDYASFHDALSDATQQNGSHLFLRRNVKFGSNDTHKLNQNVITTLHLDGHSITASNSLLDASEEGAAFIIHSDRGTGRITGNLRIAGDVYIGKETIAGNIGVVQQGNTPTQLYRLLATIESDQKPTDGIYPYTWGEQTGTCYLRDNIACLWLPTGQGDVTLRIGDKTYRTTSVTISGTHSNTVILRKPGVVAKIGNTSYSSLQEAFNAAKDKDKITLIAGTSLTQDIGFGNDLTLSLDLNGQQLACSGKAAFTGAGNLHIYNGDINGTLQVSSTVIIDNTVALTAAILENGRQAYRMRVELPTSGSNFRYSYDQTKARPLYELNEGGQPVAYLWQPAHAAAPLTLLLTGGDGKEQSKTKYDVSILPHHDNRISLKEGDTEAILFPDGKDIDKPTEGIPYETFHEALNAAGNMDKSRLRLRRDVQFSGQTTHTHTIGKDIHTELLLDGHTVTATNCVLDASAPNAYLFIGDKEGRGRIEGNFRIRGNVYIGRDIPAGNIGNVSSADGSNPLLYRVLAVVKSDAPISDRLCSWQWNGEETQTCYLSDNTACLWLPLSTLHGTLRLIIDGDSYTATDVQISASHGNTVTVKKPDLIARVGNQAYTSLEEAFAHAGNGQAVITLEQSTTFNSPLSAASGQQITLNLQGNTLTAQGAATLRTEGTGSLTLTSDTGQGTLAGNLNVTKDVNISSKISISGLVRMDGVTVYRTRLFLPEGTEAARYQYDTQSGELRFIGEKNSLGQAVGYAWLEPVTGTHDLKATITRPEPEQTKTLTEVIVQATHNNQFDMEAGNNVASLNGVYYPTLASAIEAANKAGGGIINLTHDITLRGTLVISREITIDLGEHNLAATADAAFDISSKASLRITDPTGKGIVYGTFLTDGDLVVAKEVRLAATVIHDGGKVYRMMIDGLSVRDTDHLSYHFLTSGDKGKLSYLDGTAYIWLPEIIQEEDLRIVADNVPYTALVRPFGTGHDTILKAYPFRLVNDNETWNDATYKDADIEIASGVTLTIDTQGKLGTIRRLTLGDGSQLVTGDRILATEGIRYKKSFDKPNRWETFSLPFEPRDITAEINGQSVSLSPYLASGTGGHFWLKSLQDDHTFTYVDEERILANKGYIIAVPQDLSTEGGNTGRRLIFISAGNQFLNRASLPATLPDNKQMELMATGTLRDRIMTTSFYLLGKEGQEFIRQDGVSAEKPRSIRPFTAYLLVESGLAAANASFRLAGLPTGNEIGVAEEESLPDYRLYGERETLVIESRKASEISIYSLNGQLIIKRQVAIGTTRIPLPTGNYIINQTKIHIR